MNYLAKMLDKRYESLVLIFLSLMAFIPRLLAFIFLIDFTGDGPIHAIKAYNWSESPYLLTHGIWLPGYLYLSGIFSFVVHDPLVSTRLLNLIIGTLTIPVFYILICRIFDHAAALFSASMLAFLPLHIGLSASSLTETSFMFEIIVGMMLLIKASEGVKKQGLHLSLSLLCFCLALMTRYEAWLLIPLLPCYYFWKTRKISTAILIMVVLIILPVVWMIGNYIHSGNFLPQLSQALTYPSGKAYGHSVDLFSAIRIVGHISISHLGWFLPIAIILGAILQLVQAMRGLIHSERALYTLMFCIFCTFMIYYTMGRGASLWHRYLLVCFVMALPLSILPLMYYFSNYQRYIGIFIFIAIASIGFTYISRLPVIYVTYKDPTEIRKVAAWLKKSPYRDEPILLTRMGWQSSYFPLYFPETGSRHWIVSDYTTHAKLQYLLKNHQPSILLTSDSDKERKYQSLIETVLGRKIDEAIRLNIEDTIEDRKNQSLIDVILSFLGKDINVDKKLLPSQHSIKVYDIKSLIRLEDNT